MKIKSIWNLFSILIVISIFGALSYPLYRVDIIVCNIFLFLSLSLFIVSSEKLNKFKWFLRSISVFIFFQFIFFPLIYLILLNNNPNSFEIKNSIYDTELKSTISSITELNDENSLNKCDSIINLILMDSIFNKSTYSLKYVNDENIVRLTNFMLYKTVHPFNSGRPDHLSILNVCDSNGKYIYSINSNNKGFEFENDTLSLKEFLTNIKLDASKKLVKNLKEKRMVLVEKRIWTYKQILIYSNTIFLNDNLNAISRVASVIIFVNYIICFGGLLSIVFGFLVESITKKD